jgi:hypothetical protein
MEKVAWRREIIIVREVAKVSIRYYLLGRLSERIKHSHRARAILLKVSHQFSNSLAPSQGLIVSGMAFVADKVPIYPTSGECQQRTLSSKKFWAAIELVPRIGLLLRGLTLFFPVFTAS